MGAGNIRPERPPDPAVEYGLTDEVWDLVRFCWRKTPSSRPDMNMIVQLLSRNRSIALDELPSPASQAQDKSLTVDLGIVALNAESRLENTLLRQGSDSVRFSQSDVHRAGPREIPCPYIQWRDGRNLEAGPPRYTQKDEFADPSVLETLETTSNLDLELCEPSSSVVLYNAKV